MKLCLTCRKNPRDEYSRRCDFCWEVESRLSWYVKQGGSRAEKQLLKAIETRRRIDHAAGYTRG